MTSIIFLSFRETMLFLQYAVFSFSWRLEKIPTRQLRIFHQRSFFFFCMGKLIQDLFNYKYKIQLTWNKFLVYNLCIVLFKSVIGLIFSEGGVVEDLGNSRHFGLLKRLGSGWQSRLNLGLIRIEHLKILAIMFKLFFRWAITPLMYPASFLFTESSTAYIVLICVNLFIGINTTLATFILEFFTDDQVRNSESLYISSFHFEQNVGLGEG